MIKDFEFLISKLYDYSKLFQNFDLIKDTDNFLKRILDEINNIFNFDQKGFLYFDETNKKFFLKGERITYTSFEKKYLESFYYLDLIYDKKSIIIKNLNDEEKSLHRGIFISSPESIVIIPIFFSTNFFGVLIFENKQKTNLSSNDLGILNIISSQLTYYFQTNLYYKNLQNDFLNTVKALISAIELKDYYTKGHSQRVMNYGIKFAFLLQLDDTIVEKIKWAGLLHDIGKIGIPEHILNKNSPLEQYEFEIMKKHATYSYKILEPLTFLNEERKIILHHHERWDGNGYPYGLKGNNIPLESRILAIVDSFDAMNTTRPYREKLNLEFIIQQIQTNLGKQFDPDIGKIFINFINEGSFSIEN
ncbi:MAG: HD-GYP domain-containing protein [Spirochaetes bacterium]|nr:HD-GYP domain-containing protein [Spirochaetota bacterium]